MLVLALHFVIGFPLGLVMANAGEWFIHKYVLHGLGKRRRSFWSFHWYAHHNASRRHDMYDEDYERPLTKWNGQTKEAVALLGGTVVALPLTLVAPGLAAGLLYSIFNYYYKHKKAHLDPAWGRRKLPWHVDHHMGPSQDANWCVTRPWFDVLLGTRRPYVGTELETADLSRRAARHADVAAN